MIKNKIIFYTGHNNLIGGDAKYFFILLKLLLNKQTSYRTEVYTDVNPLFIERSKQWFCQNYEFKYLNTYPKVKLIKNKKNSLTIIINKLIKVKIKNRTLFSYVNYFISLIFFSNLRFNILNFIVFLINLPKKNYNERIIFHANNGSYPGKIASIISILAAGLKKYDKIILTVHNETVSKKNYRLFDQIYDFIIRKYCTNIIAVSDNVKKSLIRFRNFDKNVISVIKVPLEDTIADDLPLQLKKLKQKYKNRKTLLISGNYEESRKGHDNLIKSIKYIKKTIPNILLLIAGTGSIARKEYLDKIIKEDSIYDNIEFLGYIDSIEVFNHFSDLIIVPSIDSEAIPYTVVEGLKAGKPIITSFYGGSKESVIDYFNGRIINPNNIQELTNSIIETLENTEKLKLMGVNSRQIYEENHESIKIFHKHMKLYN